MTRPLLALLIFSSVVLTVSALQCYVGVRAIVHHQMFAFPESPMLTVCPTQSRCCKVESRPHRAELKYCCSSDCPEDFGGQEAIITSIDPTPSYIARCTGPNGNCTWNPSIGVGKEQYPDQFCPMCGPDTCV